MRKYDPGSYPLSLSGARLIIDRFRNSAVLNDRPERRPQLFHSDGLERDLPHTSPLEFILFGYPFCELDLLTMLYLLAVYTAPNSALRHERSTQTKCAVCIWFVYRVAPSLMITANAHRLSPIDLATGIHQRHVWSKTRSPGATRIASL